jgi:Fur family ferric uptake transcriptional regulator
MAARTGSDWAEDARTTLRDSGHRAGGARDAVVELLAKQSCCVSAQQIADELRGGERAIGLASVYRALDVLHDLALVQRVDLGDGELRYEPVLPGGEHHHHAVCDRCGKVTPFEDPKLESAIERLESKLDHSVKAHELVIHGACRRCAPGA